MELRKKPIQQLYRPALHDHKSGIQYLLKIYTHSSYVGFTETLPTATLLARRSRVTLDL